MRSKTPGFNGSLSTEVSRRLQQLDYIVNRVKDLENASEKILSRHKAEFITHMRDLERRNVPFDSVPAPPMTKMTREEFEAHQKVSFEIELLTETFYYFAGRIRTILRNKRAPFQGLENFECEGVRNVHNKLLEHAERKDSQVLNQRKHWLGRKTGPRIKSNSLHRAEAYFPG